MDNESNTDLSEGSFIDDEDNATRQFIINMAKKVLILPDKVNNSSLLIKCLLPVKVMDVLTWHL